MQSCWNPSEEIQGCLLLLSSSSCFLFHFMVVNFVGQLFRSFIRVFVRNQRQPTTSNSSIRDPSLGNPKAKLPWDFLSWKWNKKNQISCLLISCYTKNYMLHFYWMSHASFLSSFLCTYLCDSIECTNTHFIHPTWTNLHSIRNKINCRKKQRTLSFEEAYRH